MCKLIEHVAPNEGNDAAGGMLNGKDLLARATGRFYTHELVGAHLVNGVTSLLLSRDSTPSVLKVIEPFCGDGRLVSWLLEEITQHDGWQHVRFEIHIWETDREVLAVAEQKIVECAARLGVEVSIIAVHGDSFAIAPEKFGCFDICITNPPWENLKPDQRELRHLDKVEQNKYTQLLKERAEMLAKLYLKSQPSRKFSGWGTNLSRCGAEAAFNLVHDGGIVGIVLPASLLADQISSVLRSWIFENYQATDLAYYVAEARLFEKVDQPSITLVATTGKADQMPALWSYSRARVRTSIPITQDDWLEIARSGYIFPAQFDVGAVRIAAKLRKLPRFGNLEGPGEQQLWSGRELDETRHNRYLGYQGRYLFTKGRMIKRFGIAEPPTAYVISEGPEIPNSADFHRLVWRDVSRPSQKRRIHATIIPPGWVTGNSLHVAYFRDNNLERLKALLGIVNSLVFECQAKTLLATGHVSLGAVRQVPIPCLDEGATHTLVPIVERCLAGDEASCIALEVTVAKLYGLTQEDFSLVLRSFGKLNDAEKDALLSHPAWDR